MIHIFFSFIFDRQQDAQEFLRYLINGLHDELNKAKCRPRRQQMIEPKSSQEAWNQYRERIDDSKLIELFVGQFSSVIKCTDCGNESTCWDPFWDLSLAVPRYRLVHINVDIQQTINLNLIEIVSILTNVSPNLPNKKHWTVMNNR